MNMPGRKFTAGSGYRYGFNGKELDNEVVQYDYGFRIYDPRLARFKSVDPLTKNYPSFSPYPFAMNNPVSGIDLDGLEFLNSEVARVEITRGIVKLKMANMHWTTQRDFNAASSNSDNWSYGPDGKKGIGISTEIGSFSLIPTSAPDDLSNGVNLNDGSLGAPDPRAKGGETKVGVNNAKSTGLPDRRVRNDRTVQTAPGANVRGLAIASIAIDALIVANNWLTSYFADDDVSLSKKHAEKAAMALYDVNTALQEGIIDKKYQTVEALSDIANVVLSGVSNSGNKEIVDLGKKIYKNVSQRRERYIGPIHTITGPSGVQILTYRDLNPNYDPNYGKNNTTPAPVKKPATTGRGG